MAVVELSTNAKNPRIDNDAVRVTKLWCVRHVMSVIFGHL